MIKILIIDDEQLARTRIKSFIEKKHPNSELKEAQDGVEGLQLIEDFKPNIVFLDIEMPELSGFDMIMQLEQRPFQLIFQTAYDEYAVKAFEVNALDYLLKPFTDLRLEDALKKAISALKEDKNNDFFALDEQLVSDKKYLSKIIVDVGSRKKIFEVDEIVYFSSENHVTRVFLRDIDYTYNKSLTYLEKRLDPLKFIRLHRHSIAKVEAISEIFGGEKMEVQLENGTRLPVARNRKKHVKEVISGI